MDEFLQDLGETTPGGLQQNNQINNKLGVSRQVTA
jgi:hypothetical protein